MKILLAILFGLTITTSAYADTPITEYTFIQFQAGFYTGCMQQAHNNNKPTQIYCACVTYDETMNMKEEIAEHHYTNEEELFSHIKDANLVPKQIEACKALLK